MSEPTTHTYAIRCRSCGKPDRLDPGQTAWGNLCRTCQKVVKSALSVLPQDVITNVEGQARVGSARSLGEHSVDRAALVELHSDLSEDLAELARIESEASVPSAPDVRVTVSRVVVRLAAALGLDS